MGIFRHESLILRHVAAVCAAIVLALALINGPSLTFGFCASQGSRTASADRSLAAPVACRCLKCGMKICCCRTHDHSTANRPGFGCCCSQDVPALAVRTAWQPIAASDLLTVQIDAGNAVVIDTPAPRIQSHPTRTVRPTLQPPRFLS